MPRDATPQARAMCTLICTATRGAAQSCRAVPTRLPDISFHGWTKVERYPGTLITQSKSAASSLGHKGREGNIAPTDREGVP